MKPKPFIYFCLLSLFILVTAFVQACLAQDAAPLSIPAQAISPGFLTSAWDWFVGHWTQVISAITAVVLAARAIVILTPTQKDDNILAGIIEFLKKVGLHISDS